MATKVTELYAKQDYVSDNSRDNKSNQLAIGRSSEPSSECFQRDKKEQALEDPISVPSLTLAPAKANEYGFYYPTTLGRGLVIVETRYRERIDKNVVVPSAKISNIPVYYSEVSEFKRKKPDITFHSVSSGTSASSAFEQVAAECESSPIIGVAYLPVFSRDIKVGIGDPHDHAKVEWIEITNPHKLHHGEYQFTWNDTAYAWKRTHDARDGVEGGRLKRAFMRDTYLLFEAASPEPIALFLENKWDSWRKRGKLRIFKDLNILGEDGTGRDQYNILIAERLKVLMFLSLAAILEKSRRRANSRHSFGGGGA